jgi:hypothetical protein
MTESTAAPPAPALHFPLLFSCTPLIRGESFLARVKTKGRLLEVVENDGIWMYGVNPGAVAGGGLNGTDAYQDFKKNFRRVLQALADSSATFKDYKGKVEAFFGATSKPSEVQWIAAVAEVRAGRISLPGVKKVADARWSIDVIDVPLAGKKAGISSPEEIGDLKLVETTPAPNNSEKPRRSKAA